MRVPSENPGNRTLGQKLGSGVLGLDTLLGGGFPEGKVVLILGEPGTGKSILCSQYLHWGATHEREKGVYIGMSEPKSRFTGEMLTLGMDFAKLEKEGIFAYVDATGIRVIPERAKVGRVPVSGKELALVDLIDIVQEQIDKLSPERVVLDSISDLIFHFPRVEERRPAVLDLVDVLQSTGTTCLLTSELLSTGEDRLLQPEEYLAEGLIFLRILRKGVRTVQILKMRGSKVDTIPRPFVINDRGMEVYATEEVYGQTVEK